MQYIKKNIHIIALFAAIAMGAYFLSSGDLHATDSQTTPEKTEETMPEHRMVEVPIENGSTFGSLMEGAGIPTSVHLAMYSATEEVYDLAHIRAGRSLQLFFDWNTDELVKLVYQIDTEEELVVAREEEYMAQENQEETRDSETEHLEAWRVVRQPIVYEIKTREVRGTIESSLYETGLDLELDERAIIALADVFQWSIDFAWDIRSGDEFIVIFEERYRNDEYVMPGNILAGKFVNNSKTYQAYFFTDNEGNEGYYDENGNSVQKIFLKAPLAFKYISSGFTTKPRYVSSLLGWTKSHTAIDYAAQLNTPIRSVGDGTVVSAGWNSRGYGNLVSIRHNETYTTNYAHQSKVLVSRGEKVSQGDIIGLVGSTGFSSGPHLHYEMVKHGVKINPLNEEFPAGDAISGEKKDAYFSGIEQYKRLLNE